MSDVVYSGLVNGSRIGKGVVPLEQYEIELIDCTFNNCLTFAQTEAAAKLTFRSCVFDFAGNMSGAGIYLTRDADLYVENSSFTQSASGTNQHAFSGSGSISVTLAQHINSFFGDGRLWTFPSSVSADIYSVDNCLVADREFEANGIYYATLAIVQADGYEESTIIGGC
jgi:hypothetical protein